MHDDDTKLRARVRELMALLDLSYDRERRLYNVLHAVPDVLRKASLPPDQDSVRTGLLEEAVIALQALEGPPEVPDGLVAHALRQGVTIARQNAQIEVLREQLTAVLNAPAQVETRLADLQAKLAASSTANIYLMRLLQSTEHRGAALRTLIFERPMTGPKIAAHEVYGLMRGVADILQEGGRQDVYERFIAVLGFDTVSPEPKPDAPTEDDEQA